MSSGILLMEGSTPMMMEGCEEQSKTKKMPTVVLPRGVLGGVSHDNGGD